MVWALRKLKALPALFFAGLLFGCAIHPLPEDYSGVPTSHIVRQIRCETREAVIDSIIGFLTKNPNKVDLPSQRIGEQYLNDRSDIRSFHPDKLSGYAKYVVGLIWKTGVADNYNLEMTENNNNDGSIDFLGGIPTSGRFLGATSKLDLQRQNTRIFTTTDTLGKLVSNIDPRYCSDPYIAEPNIIYPLTGKIGIAPVIQEFILLAIFDNLAGDATKDFSSPGGPAQLAEQLQFTTTLELSATPKVVFAPVTKSFHLIDASLTVQAMRTDLHKLTMGLYVPKTVPLAAIRGGILGSLSASPVGNLASAPVQNNAEEGALAAVNQALALKLFQANTQVIVQ